MGKGEQDLTLRAQLKGGEETAQGLDKITQAEQKVAGQTTASGKAADNAAKNVEKLSTSEGDVVAVLSRVNPALGQLVDMLFKGSKMPGDMASANINLGNVLSKGKELIKANAGALQLLLAGGAVAAGIWAITKALEAEAKAHERVAEAAKRQRDALNELKKEEADQQAAIEDIADARREGGLTADQSRAAATTARRMGEKYEQLGPENIQQAVGLFGDKGLDLNQMIDAAILAKLGKLDVSGDMSEQVRVQRLQALADRNREAIDTFRARETAQGQGLGEPGVPVGQTERWQQAFREMRATGGSTTDLEAVLKQLVGPEQDVEKLARLAQKYGGSEGLAEGEQSVVSAAPLSVLMSRLLGTVRLESPTGEGNAIGGADVIGREEFSALINAMRTLEKAMTERKEAVQNGGGQTVIHQEHSRHVYPDARAVRAATINGESDKMRREVG